MGVLDSLEGGARQAVEVFIAVMISVIFFSIALPAILDAFHEARESVPILPLASTEFLLALFLVITVILGFLGLCELAHYFSLGYSDLLKGVAFVIAGLAIMSLLIRTQNKLVAEISGEYAKIIVATASGILVSVLACLIHEYYDYS
ncbi:MAG: hypothetical protein QXK88_11520 [Desulfurococcaceae archaeon]